MLGIFLLFVYKQLSLQIKIELSENTKKDALVYHKREKIYFTLSNNRTIFFHFNVRSFPIIMLNNFSTEIFLLKKTKKTLNPDQSIIASIYIFKKINQLKKTYDYSRERKVIRKKETSIIEKTVVYILDRKNKVNS